MLAQNIVLRRDAGPQPFARIAQPQQLGSGEKPEIDRIVDPRQAADDLVVDIATAKPVDADRAEFEPAGVEHIPIQAVSQKLKIAISAADPRDRKAADEVIVGADVVRRKTNAAADMIRYQFRRYHDQPFLSESGRRHCCHDENGEDE